MLQIFYDLVKLSKFIIQKCIIIKKGLLEYLLERIMNNQIPKRIAFYKFVLIDTAVL